MSAPTSMDLLNALSQLGERDREIVFDNVVLGKSIAVLADEHGMSRSGIGLIVQKSLVKMRAALCPDGDAA